MISLNETQALTLLDRAALPSQAVAFPPEATVLLTGAAGSIGREVARRLARRGQRLVLWDRDETRLARLADELSSAPADLILGDLGSPARLESCLDRHRPDLVLHTAAVKHLPLLEHQVAEAIHSNVLATQALLEACRERGVSHTLVVSSDKAALPTSVLGATKRWAEALLIGPGERALRLANVLGSRGSVLDRWLRAESPTLEVAPAGTERWFVTHAEAADLCLAAALLDADAPVFVPRLDSPLDITLLLDRVLAQWPELNSRPRSAWQLKPGEQPREALHAAAETLSATSHPALMAAHRTHPPASAFDVDALRAAHASGDVQRMHSALFAPLSELTAP